MVFLCRIDTKQQKWRHIWQIAILQFLRPVIQLQLAGLPEFAVGKRLIFEATLL
jgi:hypothetical protein